MTYHFVKLFHKLGQAEGDIPGQQNRQDYHLHMHLAQLMPVDLLDTLKLPYLLTYSFIHQYILGTG